MTASLVLSKHTLGNAITNTNDPPEPGSLALLGLGAARCKFKA